MRHWFSGRMFRCQRRDTSSILVWRINYIEFILETFKNNKLIIITQKRRLKNDKRYK